MFSNLQTLGHKCTVSNLKQFFLTKMVKHPAVFYANVFHGALSLFKSKIPSLSFQIPVTHSPPSQQLSQRHLSFSVENILAPGRFGHPQFSSHHSFDDGN